MDVSLLSSGALKACIDGHGPPKPRFQVLSIKSVAATSDNNRTTVKYKLQLSDGIHLQAVVLGTQLTGKIQSGEISKYCIVQVEKMVLNKIQNKNADEVGGMLGHPVQLDIAIENGDPNTVVKKESTPPALNMPRQPLNQYHQPQRSNFDAPPTVQETPPKSFYGDSPASKRMRGGASHMTSSPQGGVKSIMPITALNPYQGRWTIKVRVTAKPPLRHYSNSRGEGRIMSLELVDQSGEIKATAFNEDADRLSPLVEINKVYYISRGRIKPANKQYTTCNNDYELTLGSDTTIEECFDGDSDVPSVTFNFTGIGDLDQVPKDSIIDVIGVCTSCNDIGEVTVRSTNRKVSKRDITLVDKTGKGVTCTIWGSVAESFNGSGCPVIAIKGVKVSDFNGVSLSAMGSSTVHTNPDTPEAHQLRGWYDHYGKDQSVTSLSGQTSSGFGNSPFLTLKQIKELNLGQQEKPDYFACKGITTFIKKENCLYKACPSADCNKKVTEDGSGQYFCEKCGQSFPSFKYRIIMKLGCSDFTDNCYLDCFNEGGATILGIEAKALGELKEQDEALFDSVFEEAYFKEFVFRVRAKIDTYNDEQRLRCSCVSVTPINYADEAKRLLDQVKEIISTD